MRNPGISHFLTSIRSFAVTLALLMTATFFLLRLAPGGPFDADRAWPPEVQKAIEAKYGLDQPLWRQFAGWFWDVLHGDLRESFFYVGRTVTSIIAEGALVSAAVGAGALLLALVFGTIGGALSAATRDRWTDRVMQFLTASGLCLPSYLIAGVLIIIFSVKLQWVAPALLESPSSLILPILTLTARPLALIARLTRSAMLEALTADYSRTARAKGLSPWVVTFKHALKNSLIPVITLLGPLSAQLITGSFLVETVFQLPGLGKHFVSATLNRDYPLVMGLTLFFGILLLTFNLLVDLLLPWFDPRITLEGVARRRRTVEGA